MNKLTYSKLKAILEFISQNMWIEMFDYAITATGVLVATFPKTDVPVEEMANAVKLELPNLKFQPQPDGSVMATDGKVIVIFRSSADLEQVFDAANDLLLNRMDKDRNNALN